MPAATITAAAKWAHARHKLAAEQQHAEECGFQEERRQPFIGEQRRQNIGGRIRKAAPIGAELKRHDDARDHAHAERDGENLRPEIRNAQTDFAAGEEVDAFEQRDIGRKPHGESGQKDVKRDHPGKLKSRKKKRIEMHASSLERHGNHTLPIGGLRAAY